MTLKVNIKEKQERIAKDFAELETITGEQHLIEGKRVKDKGAESRKRILEDCGIRGDLEYNPPSAYYDYLIKNNTELQFVTIDPNFTPTGIILDYNEKFLIIKRTLSSFTLIVNPIAFLYIDKILNINFVDRTI
jgi:hypothetical protein